MSNQITDKEVDRFWQDFNAAYSKDFTQPDKAAIRYEKAAIKVALEAYEQSRLTTALKEAEEKWRWQSIDSAPKDGTVITIYTKKFGKLDCSWEDCSERIYPYTKGRDLYEWVEVRLNLMGQCDSATHWIPTLPHPPVEGE